MKHSRSDKTMNYPSTRNLETSDQKPSLEERSLTSCKIEGNSMKHSRSDKTMNYPSTRNLETSDQKPFAVQKLQSC